MHSTVKTVVFWVVTIFAAALFWQLVKAKPAEQSTPEISYSSFLSQVEGGNVKAVSISKTQVLSTKKDGTLFRVTAPGSQEGMLQILRQNNVEIWFKDVPDGSWESWLLNLAPLLLLAALWFFMIRQMKKRQASPPANQPY